MIAALWGANIKISAIYSQKDFIKKVYGPQNLIHKRFISLIFVESNYFERNHTYKCAPKKLQGQNRCQQRKRYRKAG
jgi:hypothetical protein